MFYYENVHNFIPVIYNVMFLINSATDHLLNIITEVISYVEAVIVSKNNYYTNHQSHGFNREKSYSWIQFVYVRLL